MPPSRVAILVITLFPSLLRDNFIGYRILGWCFFSLNTLSVLFHSLLACVVSGQKVNVILIFVLSYVRYFSSLGYLGGSAG